MDDQQLERYIRMRCHECGDCLLWSNAVNDTGSPVMHVRGMNGVKSVRRLMLQLRGVVLKKNHVATVNCGNSRCLAEGHLVQISRKQLQIRSCASHRYNVVRSANIAKVVRQRTHRTKEQVDQARAECSTVYELMERLQISKAHAYRIMRGDNWKDYSKPSPFAGLLASNDSHRRAA